MNDYYLLLMVNLFVCGSSLPLVAFDTVAHFVHLFFSLHDYMVSFLLPPKGQNENEKTTEGR